VLKDKDLEFANSIRPFFATLQALITLGHIVHIQNFVFSPGEAGM
jgi:hypothetical protein